MPRKNRRAPETPLGSPSPLLRQHAPSWAGADDAYDVREVGGEKEYRCPGCDHLVRAGARHLVVVPVGDTDARRHWHTKCWQSDLRRRGFNRRTDGA
ncbi:MAG: hypothetical protein WD096_04365 [Actinomycetota bacterium]